MVDNSQVQHIRSSVDAILNDRHDEIYGTVRQCIAEVLSIDPGKVSPHASLIDELGAESIDFLDLIFRLESAFSIKIPRDGIRLAAQDGLSDGFERAGIVTDAGLERLRVLMPEVDNSRLTSGFRSHQIPNLFSPETFVRLVAWRLASPAGAA
jgi:acyl carrier protein